MKRDFILMLAVMPQLVFDSLKTAALNGKEFTELSKSDFEKND